MTLGCLAALGSPFLGRNHSGAAGDHFQELRLNILLTFTRFPEPRGMLDFLESGILTRRIHDDGQEVLPSALYNGP